MAESEISGKFLKWPILGIYSPLITFAPLNPHIVPYNIEHDNRLTDFCMMIRY